MAYFTIADLHLWHDNFLEFEGLGISQEEYLEMVRNNWNKTVSSSDTVFILGDFIWKTARVEEAVAYVRSLNGRKVLVLGNHDQVMSKPEAEKLRSCFAEIHNGYLELKYNKVGYRMSHYPINMSHGHWSDSTCMLYGHVHSTAEEELTRKFNAVSHLRFGSTGHRMLNVGAMHIGYTPILLEDAYVEAGKQRDLEVEWLLVRSDASVFDYFHLGGK